jgi:hypothetical protein
VRIRLVVLAFVVLAISSGAGLTSSGATGNSIAVHGPSKNLFHTYFNETVTGFAAGGANYVISGEQLYPTGGCSPVYLIESKRTDWYQWPTGTGAVHGRFSLIARFWARNHNTHGICTYLVNSTTKHTFAHAGLFWNNS